MKYFRGICHICGKGIYLNEPYKTDSNLVCEIIVCSECHKKAIGLLKDSMKEIDALTKVEEKAVDAWIIA